MPEYALDWSRAADIDCHGRVCHDCRAPALSTPGGPLRYESGMCLPYPEMPSKEPYYSLSGRATVDALLLKERTNNGLRLDAGRYMPDAGLRAALAERITNSGVTRKELSAHLGVKGNDAIYGRLQGRYKWKIGEMEAIEAYLDEKERGPGSRAD